jgi:hypothetical protein
VTTWAALTEAVRRSASRPAVAVHVAGRPGGLIRLRAGEVVGTWTAGTPLAVPSPEPGTRSAVAAASPLVRLAITDAVFVMAAGRIGSWRAEDDRSADAGGARMGLEAVLAEVERRLRRVSGPDGLLPPEETVVQRIEHSEAWRSLAPTPEERRLLDALTVDPDSPRGNIAALRTVRDLAFAVRRGVFAVLLDVHRLAAMGAVVLSARSPAPAEAEQPLLVQARSALDGPAVAAVSAALRRHRVEMGDRPPVEPVQPQSGASTGSSAGSSAGAPTGPPPLTAVPSPGQPAGQRPLTRRVPGVADRGRRRAPWQPRRQPNQPDGEQ